MRADEWIYELPSPYLGYPCRQARNHSLPGEVGAGGTGSGTVK